MLVNCSDSKPLILSCISKISNSASARASKFSVVLPSISSLKLATLKASLAIANSSLPCFFKILPNSSFASIRSCIVLLSSSRICLAFSASIKACFSINLCSLLVFKSLASRSESSATLSAVLPASSANSLTPSAASPKPMASRVDSNPNKKLSIALPASSNPLTNTSAIKLAIGSITLKKELNPAFKKFNPLFSLLLPSSVLENALNKVVTTAAMAAIVKPIGLAIRALNPESKPLTPCKAELKPPPKPSKPSSTFERDSLESSADSLRSSKELFNLSTSLTAPLVFTSTSTSIRFAIIYYLSSTLKELSNSRVQLVLSVIFVTCQNKYSF